MILLCNCSLSLNVFNIGLQCNLRFLSTTVLQGSVATWVNDGGIFNDFFIANLLLSVMVKEFWRSVRIWQSCGKKYSGTFFSRTRCSGVFRRSGTLWRTPCAFRKPADELPQLVRSGTMLKQHTTRIAEVERLSALPPASTSRKYVLDVQTDGRTDGQNSHR